MTFITSDNIGLEDFEKLRGVCEFSIDDIETPNIQMDYEPPKTKRITERIIIRDGRNRHSGKNTELF
jgi:hypothetical protein